jgi:hypothetical protein
VSDIDLQPDVPDVLQEEAPPTFDVPVCITDQTGPLRTQALPRKGGATQTRVLTTTPFRVLTADPRRARARIMAAAAADVFLVAFTETAAQAESTMCLWNGREPFIHDATTEVWLSVPATPGTAVTVGVATELWAEGEGPRG